MIIEKSNEFDLVIEPGRSERNYWNDIWRFRELFLFMAWRDILVRYKQTAIGLAWSIIRPVLTMLVFTLVFGRLAKLPSEGVPTRFWCFLRCFPGNSSQHPSVMRAHHLLVIL